MRCFEGSFLVLINWNSLGSCTNEMVLFYFLAAVLAMHF